MEQPEKPLLSVSDEALAETFVSDPVTVSAEDAGAYAAATNDDNPRYKDGATPPIFPVRYHMELAQKALFHEGVEANIMRLVHGEQAMSYLKPIRVGDVLRPSLKIDGVERKSSGDIMMLRFKLERDGDVVNEAVSRYFIRRKGGSKAKKPAELFGDADFEVPYEVAEDQSRRYAKASTDVNPIHTTDEVAKAAGFEGVILHGLCSMAFASRALVAEVADGDPARLSTMAVRFSKPVLMGEVLTTRGRIVDTDSGMQRVVFEVTNRAGVPIITQGEAVVRDA